MFQPRSSLGFGCAQLLNRASPKRAAELLEFALDQGVSHFDVARSYGDGRAEAVIGALAKRRRGEMTIVTKVGMAAPSVWARAKRRLGLSQCAPAPIDFRPRALRRSVETSLRALGLEHVDALLLHECAPEDVTDDVVEVLHALQREGKAGFLGVATSGEYARRLCGAWPKVFAIAQTPYHECEPAVSSGAVRVVHSVLPRASKPGSTAAPLAAEALTRAMGSADIVLFWSANREHIAQNARLMAPRLDANASACPSTGAVSALDGRRLQERAPA